MPSRHVSFKPKHNIRSIIDQNVSSAKRAGRSMISNTKYFKKNMKNTHNFAKSDDFFSKCKQIWDHLKISPLLKKFLTENINFCAAYKANMWKWWYYSTTQNMRSAILKNMPGFLLPVYSRIKLIPGKLVPAKKHISI